MEALFITKIGVAEFRSIPEPVAGSDEVLLQINHVGLCGSDLNTYRGLNPLAALPRIPGHEIGATILSAGSSVPPEFTPGSSVIVNPYSACGTCSSCVVNRGNACRFNETLGVQRDGGMTRKLAVPHGRLILNERLPASHLALVEPLSVGFHAAHRGSIDASDTVVVLGAGMIGVGVMIGALARGARVIAVEVSDEKRQSLIDLGVEVVINPNTSDTLAEVNRLTDNRGANVVVEAVGLPDTFRLAIDLAGFAGRIVYVGYSKDEVSYDTKLFNLKELDIFGSRNATSVDFQSVIVWLEQNVELASRLISRVFPWHEAEQAFDYWESVRNTTFKVMIDLTEMSDVTGNNA